MWLSHRVVELGFLTCFGLCTGEPDFGAPGCVATIARDVYGEGVVGTGRWDQLFWSVLVSHVVRNSIIRPILIPQT
jgi:hypothetical protein